MALVELARPPSLISSILACSLRLDAGEASPSSATNENGSRRIGSEGVTGRVMERGVSCGEDDEEEKEVM